MQIASIISMMYILKELFTQYGFGSHISLIIHIYL